jgi:hypothetical protein
MVKGIIYNSNVEDLAKEPEVTIVPGVTTASIFTGTKKSTGRISNKSGQISKI